MPNSAVRQAQHGSHDQFGTIRSIWRDFANFASNLQQPRATTADSVGFGPERRTQSSNATKHGGDLRQQGSHGHVRTMVCTPWHHKN